MPTALGPESVFRELVQRVVHEARRTGTSPWQFRRAVLAGELYRSLGWTARLGLRFRSWRVARRAEREL